MLLTLLLILEQKRLIFLMKLLNKVKIEILLAKFEKAKEREWVEI